MDMDINLKAEVVSLLFGQAIRSFDNKAFHGRRSLDTLSVDEFHLGTLIGNRRPYRQLAFDEHDFFDPQYDYDFTNVSASKVCLRGNEEYKRPEGWYRMALKVKGKYPDGDAWLGNNEWRRHSSPGEWPVSYHGTSLGGAKGVIKEHYKAGDRAMYGRGIYSTPDISVAEREEYASTFRSQTTGKRYKVILQNRINPKERKICSRRDYWLIPVKKGTSPAEERAIVERSIQPYGILIREIRDDDDDDEDGGEEVREEWEEEEEEEEEVGEEDEEEEEHTEESCIIL